jgi:hypothetical protein
MTNLFLWALNVNVNCTSCSGSQKYRVTRQSVGCFTNSFSSPRRRPSHRLMASWAHGYRVPAYDIDRGRRQATPAQGQRTLVYMGKDLGSNMTLQELKSSHLPNAESTSKDRLHSCNCDQFHCRWPVFDCLYYYGHEVTAVNELTFAQRSFDVYSH